MTNQEILTKRLIEVRKKNGYTRKRLAEELNRPYRTITNYETGEHEPGHKYLIEIAKKFNVTTDYLLGTSDSPFPQTNNSGLLYSSEALDLAQDYDFMDTHGKKMMRLVADEEKARCIALKAKRERARSQTEESNENGAESVVYVVSRYYSPMSAGTGQIAGQETPEEQYLIKRPPRGTSYIAPVSGDSMEPTYEDGDLLFIHATPEIEVGQVGVFLMDGQQWVKELGDGVLISHNEDYKPIPMTEDIVCQGLVLGVCDDSYFE